MRARSGFRAVLGNFLIVLMLIGLTGCSALIRNAAQPTIESILNAAMKQSDLELVRQGAPSFMLMVDGLIERNPDDAYLLAAGARLYSAYSSAFVVGHNPERARDMTLKAKKYAFRAMSVKSKMFAERCEEPYDRFEPVAASIKPEDVDLLFVVVSTWAGYVEAHQDNWDVVAELPKIELLTRRLLELDETYYYGSAHLIMGVLETLLPPALGGKPEEGRRDFEKAIEISHGHYLQVQVMYASHYARMVGDRELYRELLEHVLETTADAIPELTLANVVAKSSAKELLANIDEYF